MTFKTVPRNEVLLQLEQAKNKKEQRKILCDLLECSEKEFDVLVDKLTAEREANRLDPQEAVKIAPPVQSKKVKKKSIDAHTSGELKEKDEEKAIMQDMESKNEDTSAEESQKERDAKVCAFLIRENQLLRAAALKATELAAIFAQLSQIGRN